MNDKKLINGIIAVHDERARQLELGRNASYDACNNTDGQLIAAVAELIKPAAHVANCPRGWNIDAWVKMRQKPYVERLAIAGALCAAEIDRLEYVNKETQLRRRLKKAEEIIEQTQKTLSGELPNYIALKQDVEQYLKQRENGKGYEKGQDHDMRSCSGE